MPVVRLDEAVFQKLQGKAAKWEIPFSNANNILRIILKLEPLDRKRHQPKK